MHLYLTHQGDKWVCITCQEEEAEMIKDKNWEWLFEKVEPTLRCALCKRPDFEFDD